MELISVSFIQVVKQLSKLTVNAFRKCDELQTQVTKAYAKQPGDKRIDRNPYNQLVSQKASIILGNLQLKQCQLIFIIRKQVRICIAIWEIGHEFNSEFGMKKWKQRKST